MPSKFETLLNYKQLEIQTTEFRSPPRHSIPRLKHQRSVHRRKKCRNLHPRRALWSPTVAVAVEPKHFSECIHFARKETKSTAHSIGKYQQQHPSHVVFWRRTDGRVSDCYAIDCFGTYFTHVQTCANIRVQSATQSTASLHTLHISTPVLAFVFKVPRNRLLRYILYTCPNL